MSISAAVQSVIVAAAGRQSLPRKFGRKHAAERRHTALRIDTAAAAYVGRRKHTALPLLGFGYAEHLVFKLHFGNQKRFDFRLFAFFAAIDACNEHD